MSFSESHIVGIFSICPKTYLNKYGHNFHTSQSNVWFYKLIIYWVIRTWLGTSQFSIKSNRILFSQLSWHTTVTNSTVIVTPYPFSLYLYQSLCTMILAFLQTIFWFISQKTKIEHCFWLDLIFFLPTYCPHNQSLSLMSYDLKYVRIPMKNLSLSFEDLTFML